ncbi:MAG: xanthine dehydrogenase, partial [Chloroflexi bacterium UTCFX4]
MNLSLTINHETKEIEIQPRETLLRALRRNGYFGVKHGCENGECGACAVLIDGVPMNSCVMLAAQAEGKNITTIEALGQVEEQGWKRTEGLDPLQNAFIETGAIQCGYCTPALILAAKALLEKNPQPNENKVREALSGVLCRCTGYVKPVEAVMQAIREPRVETGDLGIPVPLEFFQPPSSEISYDETPISSPQSPISNLHTPVSTLPQMLVAPTIPQTSIVGKSEKKVDAQKLAQGKPAFTDDIEL